ncbi:MAG: hypothetical protein LUQ71_07240 [Methanoregula sp.]|nr:hypothetical protein [Methanoregula sp.]
MKRVTCLTCSFIVTCMIAAIDPVGRKRTWEKFLPDVLPTLPKKGIISP